MLRSTALACAAVSVLETIAFPQANQPFSTVRPSGHPPKITAFSPATTSPGSFLKIHGRSIGVEDYRRQRVLFVRGSITHVVRSGGGGRVIKDGVEGPQYAYVRVPAVLEPGRWQVVIDANGRRTSPKAIDIVSPRSVVWKPFWQPRPHPSSQLVQLETTHPPQVDDELEITDSRGVSRILENGASWHGFTVVLPDHIAEGEVSIRVRRRRGDSYSYSSPLKLSVTLGPSPLTTSALQFMRPVAAAQWTDLTLDTPDVLEIARTDRVQIEFRQGDRVFTSDATGRYRTHIQIPSGLRAGRATARSRTWIKDTASEWSAPARIRITKRAAIVMVEAIQTTPARELLWLGDRTTPRFFAIAPGQAIGLVGKYPVAKPADLRVQLTKKGDSLELRANDRAYERDDLVEIPLPEHTLPGDWHLWIGPRDRSTRLQRVTILRVR